MDKIGKSKVIFPALDVAIIGAVIMFFIKDQIGVIIGGIILMAGYLVSTAILASKTRDYIPDDKMGFFQGVRMIFVVMLPMVTGPYIGQAVSYINGHMYTDETYGISSIEPNHFIFLFAGIVMLFVFIPLILLTKREKNNEPTASE